MLTDLTIQNSSLSRRSQTIDVLPDNRNLCDVEEAGIYSISFVLTFDRVEDDREVGSRPTLPSTDRSDDGDGSTRLKFTSVEFFVRSGENRWMISIVLNELRVGYSTIGEVPVIVLRVRHDTFEQTLPETQLFGDCRVYDLRT